MAFDQLLTSRVRRKLAMLRGLLRAHLLGRGLCWLIVAVVAAVFLTLGVDRLLHMDRAQRALIVAVALGGIGYVLWRFLLRPLRVPMNAEEMALVLEARYPQLGDRLISALQFGLRPGSRVGASDAMVLRMADQANAVAAELDARAAVASSGTWRRAAWPVAALAVLTVFTLCNSELMALWFRRNVLFQDVRWPQRTYLTVEGGPQYRVVRGGRLGLVVSAEGEWPDHVTFHMSFASLPGEVREAVGPTKLGGNVYVKDMENVSEGFTFYVTGNDDRTDRRRVVVVNPPELVALEGVKRYPDYMSRPPGKFSPKRGLIAVPAGSNIFFTGRADKDLQSAALRVDGELVTQLEIKQTAPDSDEEFAGRPRLLVGSLRLPEQVEKPSMLVNFELIDTEGIPNPRGASYSLRIEPDRPPAVSMTRRHVRGDVTARAMIPLEIEARDGYGVAALTLSVQPMAGEPPTTQPAAKEFPVGPFQAGEKDVRVEQTADLAPLELKLGQRVGIRAIARDTLPPSFGGPNVSRSVVQTFKIVSDDELMEELIRRQREISQDFARTVMLQGEVLARVAAVGDRLASAGIDVEIGRRLRSAASDQRRVAQQCAVTAQQLQGVLDEMIFNRVGELPDRRILGEAIITPLADYAKKTMPALAETMDGASKLTEAQPLREYVAEAVGLLDELVRSLEEIQKQMAELRSRQELANRLKAIVTKNEEVLDAIDKLLKGRLPGVLQGEGKPKP